MFEPFKVKLVGFLARWDRFSIFRTIVMLECQQTMKNNTRFSSTNCYLHPKFPELISSFKDELDTFDNFVVTVSEVNNFQWEYALNSFPDSCQYACRTLLGFNNIKYHIIEWTSLDPKKDTVQPLIFGSKNDIRGWYHTTTALALTQSSRVKNGTLRIGAHNFPAFLYLDGTIYDPDDPETGLFRGSVLIRALTAKSLALDGYRSASRLSLAKIHSVREVFLEIVA
ncbi:hypothetical protein GALMADRAFT_145574 [Galerina marginata CBS 339.88]|uniref:Uncharacterized protein n=1 Tax=Galerina marginata (strain CBS 339.88) TaxID=685588 RepID=A0A067SN80_GALM3|nr:hypothetical protein GALMADRAFT_145574 [Galerina marginata CBS 339.88]